MRALMTHEQLISIHAPAKGATKLTIMENAKVNFNPRSREGSDLPASVCIAQAAIISIHAPAKGATKNHVLVPLVRKISIHAPAKGATGDVIQVRIEAKFQSTLPRRERLPNIPGLP